MNKNIKLITYNIDGLTDKIDLNDLPWILKPIAWVYKLIKGTTIIKVNDNVNVSENINKISKYLNDFEFDIIGVQEDFNYHDNLMNSLKTNYNDSTFINGLDLKHIFSCVSWLPYPRLKADGINLISKKSKVTVKNEQIIKWKNSYGYFTHANDKLTKKGFRFYTLTIDGEFDLDVYIVHMDADYYNPVTCNNVDKDIEARKKQLIQLNSYIIDSKTNNPIIIMGDTNSTNNYSWDVENITKYLLEPLNSTGNLEIGEAIPTNRTDVDRLFYVNNTKSNYNVKLNTCYYDIENVIGLSDHFPFITELILEKK